MGRMVAMDLIDKNILYELLVNCRTSYQALAKKLDLSVNAVKKRIEKLKTNGIIRSFGIFPSLAMLEAETTIAVIQTDEPVTDDIFLDTLGAYPLIYAGSILTNGDVLCFSHYVGSAGLDELGTFLRQVEGVKDVEFHTILAERGSKCELKTTHLKVIQCLREDARMPISEIAKKARLTPRRVRKVLRELSGEEGSEPEIFLHGKVTGDARTIKACFHFRINWDLNAGGYTAFIIRITYKGGPENREMIVNWLKEKYPFEFWYAYTSAFEPVIFSIFMVEHMREANGILAELNQTPEVESVKALFGYPTKRYPGLYDTYLDELINRLKTPK